MWATFVYSLVHIQQNPRVLSWRNYLCFLEIRPFRPPRKCASPINWGHAFPSKTTHCQRCTRSSDFGQLNDYKWVTLPWKKENIYLNTRTAVVRAKTNGVRVKKTTSSSSIHLCVVCFQIFRRTPFQSILYMSVTFRCIVDGRRHMHKMLFELSSPW